VGCEWDTTARMEKFAKLPELRKAIEDASVISKSEVSFYSKLEELSAG